MRGDVQVEGLADLQTHVVELSTAFEGSLREHLALIGEGLASAMQDNILSEGRSLADRGIVWPELHWLTVRIRQQYGHTGGKLVRGGDLLHSIRVLRTTDDSVEVGSRLPYAAAVHFGGPHTDPRTGQTRNVQAFPFAVPSLEVLDDMAELLLDLVVPNDGGAAG